MSLNKFTSDTEEKKWMNIRANSLSIGPSPCTLSTKTYTPTIAGLEGCSVGTVYQARYTSNGNSLFINGTVDITSVADPLNQIEIFVSLPVDVASLFVNQGLFSMGYLTEQDINTITNNGLISSADWSSGGVRLQIMYSKSNTAVKAYRIRYNIQIYR